MRDNAIVLEYIEGDPVFLPEDIDAFTRAYARQLATIHQTPWKAEWLEFLPRQIYGPQNPGENLNAGLREPIIREALRSRGTMKPSNPPVLRHGDFWPGNVVWRGSEIAGVIDWEESVIGEPLSDLAICRLDLWWLFGRETSDEFTREYLALNPVDTAELPLWDLWASLRPIGNLAAWAAAYPELGRPDVTLATMSRDHQQFVDRALDQVSVTGV